MSTMKLIQFILILTVLNLITGLTTFSQDTTGGRWLSNNELEILTYYAEKGEISETLIPEQEAQIKDLLEKSEVYQLKIDDLQTFNNVLTVDNTELQQKLRKSKQKNQLFKVLSISFVSIAIIEAVILIISLN